MLEVRDLCVSYGKHQALKNAQIQVSKGEIVVILGANGAGKSTLLKALSGICEGKVEGDINLSGHPLDGLSADLIVEQGIALVPEGRGIFGDLSVEENLKLGGFPDRAKGEEQANLERVFNLFPKLIERRKQIVRTMSGGEQQMVAIGRAMMSSPDILMLDEPSLGLSPLLCKELFHNLKAVRALGIGVLMVEQNAKQSLAIADRGYLLENTRIVHEDRAEALITDPAVQAAYLGGGGSAAASKSQRVSSSISPQEKGEQTAPVLAASEPLKKMSITPSRPVRKNADVLAGMDLSDLVAKASKDARTAKLQPEQRPELRPERQPAHDNRALSPIKGTRSDSIQAMIKEFEIAAAKAGHSRALPAYQAKPSGPTVTTKQPLPADANESDKPVTIEIYRAPRVEIFRRRPSGDFERD